MTFFYGKRNGMKTAPIGAEKKSRIQWEAMYAKTFEETLHQHRLDFWHCTVAQRSQPGWPDYVVFGEGWMGFVELKARSMLGKKRMGVVSEGQERYKASIEAAGGEWKVFKLPDDWHTVDTWLNGHTGKGIWGVTR